MFFCFWLSLSATLRLQLLPSYVAWRRMYPKATRAATKVTRPLSPLKRLVFHLVQRNFWPHSTHQGFFILFVVWQFCSVLSWSPACLRIPTWRRFLSWKKLARHPFGRIKHRGPMEVPRTRPIIPYVLASFWPRVVFFPSWVFLLPCTMWPGRLAWTCPSKNRLTLPIRSLKKTALPMRWHFWTSGAMNPMKNHLPMINLVS